LFYWLGERRSFLWVITAKKTVLLTLSPSAEIDAAYGLPAVFLDPRDPLEAGNQDGKNLYAALIQPPKS